MNILPKVNGRYERLPGGFVLPKEITVEETFPVSVQVFAERVKKMDGCTVTVKKSDAIICFQKNAEWKEEKYGITVKNQKITITAAGERGYAYGLVTILQMMEEGKGTLENCEIQDEPRFESRGMMLDVCRHFFPADEVKKIIEQMSLLKMNRFHWHLTNDQGMRIESRRFPKLNRVGSFRILAQNDPVVQNGHGKKGERYGGYYTQDEIRDVVKYAMDRQVEIVPELSMPGHSSAILAAYPEYSCSGKILKVRNTFGVHERIFCAGKEETFSFLQELLDEIMELFPGEYVHLGGDEAPKGEWRKCPDCGRKMKELGLQNYEELQCYFTNRMAEHLRKRGKKAIVWQEASFAGNLDETAVIQYWMEMGGGPSYVEPEIKKGRKFLLSNMNQFYCDYSYAEIPLRATLCYEPWLKEQRLPDENVFGIEAPMWTEWTAESKDVEKMIYPRMLAVAECGWTKEREKEEFLLRAETYSRNQVLSVLTPMPWEEATVGGQEALQMIAFKMLELGQKYGNMAEGEALEEAGKAEAVTPEAEPAGTQKNMQEMISGYITERMKAAYTKEDIQTVIQMIVKMMIH